MASVVAQLYDVLAVPVFLIYSLKTDPIIAFLALAMLAYILYSKAACFTTRRYVEEAACKYGISATTLRIILSMADSFDLWTRKVSAACRR